MATIEEAGPGSVDLVAPLFDAYRVFYKQQSDLSRARDFISQRLLNKESRIFLASVNGQAIGFVQLFPSFSSVSTQPLYILNDLYVHEDFRKMGIATSLLNHAKKVCEEMGYKGLALETAVDNPAQQLYEQLGWKKDTACFHYFWSAGK